MALNNPMAGGPDYAGVLRNALENKPGAYAVPPSTGGEQVSIRLPEFTGALIDAITARCQRPVWNRSQVLNALIDRGLYDLFNLLGDKTAKALVDDIASKTVPKINPFAGMADRLRQFNRFRLYPAMQERKPGGLFGELEVVWTSAEVDEVTGALKLSGDGWSLPLHLSHLVDLVRDTTRDAADAFKNVYLQLNVAVVRQGRNTLKVIPLHPTALESTQGKGPHRPRKA
jgi:hypothetical protein